MARESRIFVVNIIFIFVVISNVLSTTSTKVSPVILTSPSGSFSTPTFPSPYPAATEYIWLIKTGQDTYIKLTFDVVDVEEYRGKCIDIVEIKDGGDSSAPLIGRVCNANKPTTSFMSSSNVLRIWFQSAKNSDGGAGFNASYTTLKDQACGGQLSKLPTTLSTPRYPLPYPDNRQCRWNVSAPAGMFINVEFHGVYHLEGHCMSVFKKCYCIDTLDIKDGNKPLPYLPSISGYCTGKPHTFTSKSNYVSLTFNSGTGGRYEGFNATLTTSLTSGCGADFYSDQGTFKTPNYPHGYLSLTKCIWRISVPAGRYVVLNFQTFDIAVDNNPVVRIYPKDRVEIYDGYTNASPLLGSFSNANAVDTVNSTGNQMFVVFQSGYNRKNAKGFNVMFFSQEESDGQTRKRRDWEEGSSHKKNGAVHGAGTSLKLTGFLGLTLLLVFL